MNIPQIASSNVAGKRSMMSSITFFPVRVETPKSPWTIRLR